MRVAQAPGFAAAWAGALLLAGCGDAPSTPGPAPFAPTSPAGTWTGKVSSHETPMKDHARTLTRRVEAEFWFTLRWDPATSTGIAIGEADAVYDAVLTVKNLPKVSAPVPGGTVKFEPEVGGTLTPTDNRRRFPIVGVLTFDARTGRGSLMLQKAANPDTRTQAQRDDDTARGVAGPDAPMEFTLRADPGVSGGLSGAAGGLAYDGNRVSGGAAGADVGADVGGPSALVVQAIPMKPFSPFVDAPGTVEKRTGGPFVAAFEERADKHVIVWNVEQRGGESRAAPPLTPDLQRQIADLLASMRRGR